MATKCWSTKTSDVPEGARRQWRADRALRGTYGYRRVHAELTMAMGVTVSDKTVFTLMWAAGIYGLPGPTRTKRLRGL